MTVLQAVVLGTVQGITEFLPISSDGHMALVYAAIGQTPDLTYEIFLHGATLLAMIAYFRNDIRELLSAWLPAHKNRAEDRRTGLLIVVGTAASGAIALWLEPVVEPMAASLSWVGFWFLVTASALVLAELLGARVRHTRTTAALPFWKAFGVGVAQGSAVLPGLSRSGTTIAGGMLAGLDREHAARFSFLLGIPVITLATGRDLLGLLDGSTVLPPLAVALAGFVAALVAGYLAIWGLLAFVKEHRLYWFAAYTAALGTAILVSETIAARG